MKKLLTAAGFAAMLLLCDFSHAQIFAGKTDQFKIESTDTIFRHLKVDSDSFTVRYIHGKAYMSTLVGRLICDSAMKNCKEDSAWYEADRHYYSRIQVFKDGMPMGDEMDGYYVPHGCYEDVPKNWVDLALKRKK